MTTLTQALTDAEVAAFRNDGYLLPQRPLLSDDAFARLTTIFERLLSERGTNLDLIHYDNPELMEFLMDDHVLDVVESLIGPNFGLWSSHFISKEPDVGRATPWHEDSAYWMGRFDNFSGIVTIWLAIDPSTRENGCMRVIPGTHDTEASSYVPVDTSENIFNREIPDIDESKAVYFELEPNHYSLHDSRIIHGAEANTSTTRRCGYTMRYFSQDMKFIKGDSVNKLWHCRGENPHNNPCENL